MAKKSSGAAVDAVVKARVLSATLIGDRIFEANDIVSGSLAEIKALEELGAVDSDEDAVAYAESLASPPAA